jgi:hypothetical protein
MKSTLLSIFFALLVIGCTKKEKVEPEIVIEPTNELLGTTWQRTLVPDRYNYLKFKTSKEVEFWSKYDGELSALSPHPYTLKGKEVVYISNGFHYTGILSNDTLTVTGTAGILIYVKIK